MLKLAGETFQLFSQWFRFISAQIKLPSRLEATPGQSFQVSCYTLGEMKIYFGFMGASFITIPSLLLPRKIICSRSLYIHIISHSVHLL